MDDIDTLVPVAINEINQSSDLPALMALKVRYLGKKGLFTQYLKQVGQLPIADRPVAGQKINQAKTQFQHAFEDRQTLLNQQHIQDELQIEQIDVSLPSRDTEIGGLHPVTIMAQHIQSLLQQFGFTVVDGPEIEDDYHNFEALNIAQHHPARAMHDTFYFGDGRLLRTHTSSVQIRMMEQSTPPFRFIAPGRVYRCDSDMTHSPMFHQIEGLLVDHTVHFTDLKGLIVNFLQALFGTSVEIRFRPSYFPFTEPSAEVDIMGESGWLEVLGCGMVHPQVLSNVGVDHELYTGLAFGMGVDRLAMLYYNIPDLRLMFDNDLRFLRQFN